MISGLIGLALFIAWIYGLILALRVSILLGILTIIMPLAGVVWTVAYVIFKRDLPAMIVERCKG